MPASDSPPSASSRSAAPGAPGSRRCSALRRSSGGAAVGHALDMVRSHNFAPGNAGVIFWTDILLPVFGFALLALARRA